MKTFLAFSFWLLASVIMPAATSTVTVNQTNTLTTPFYPSALSPTQVGNGNIWKDRPFVLGLTAFTEGLEILTPAASVDLDWNTARTKRITIDQNTAFNNLNAPTSSTNVERMVVQVIGDGVFTILFNGVTFQTAQVDAPPAGVRTFYVLESDVDGVAGYADNSTIMQNQIIGPGTPTYYARFNTITNVGDGAIFDSGTNVVLSAGTDFHVAGGGIIVSNFLGTEVFNLRNAGGLDFLDIVNDVTQITGSEVYLNAETYFNGGIAMLSQNTYNADGAVFPFNYTINLVDTSGGNVTITNNNAVLGRTRFFRKDTSDANTMTIAADAGFTIDGQASISTSATNFPSYLLYYDGVALDWKILASHGVDSGGGGASLWSSDGTDLWPDPQIDTLSITNKDAVLPALKLSPPSGIATNSVQVFASDDFFGSGSPGTAVLVGTSVPGAFEGVQIFSTAEGPDVIGSMDGVMKFLLDVNGMETTGYIRTGDPGVGGIGAIKVGGILPCSAITMIVTNYLPISINGNTNFVIPLATFTP